MLRHALWYREQEQLCVVLRHLAVNFSLIPPYLNVPKTGATQRRGWGGLQTIQSKFKQGWQCTVT